MCWNKSDVLSPFNFGFQDCITESQNSILGGGKTDCEWEFECRMRCFNLTYLGLIVRVVRRFGSLRSETIHRTLDVPRPFVTGTSW